MQHKPSGTPRPIRSRHRNPGTSTMHHHQQHHQRTHIANTDHPPHHSCHDIPTRQQVCPQHITLPHHIQQARTQQPQTPRATAERAGKRGEHTERSHKSVQHRGRRDKGTKGPQGSVTHNIVILPTEHLYKQLYYPKCTTA